MQYLSHNMPCECNTRRGQSNRLKTNLLHFAALLLLALAPRVGWAQAQPVTVTDKFGFREALEDPDVNEIIIGQDFVLGKAHKTAPGIGSNANQVYGSVYRVLGNKTIKGQNKTIYRGDEYLNTSICIHNGASLTIENLTFDGRKNSDADSTNINGMLVNFGPMIGLPDKNLSSTETQIYPENGQLTMKNCTIKHCRSKKTTDFRLDSLNPKYPQGTCEYSWYGLHSNGGAAISFMPTKVNSGTATNRIHLENCVFYNNKILESDNSADVVTEIGGAIIIGGNEAMGGEIKNCTIQGNYAYLYGGGIYFTGALPNNPDRKFEFTGHNLIDGNSTIQSGGGMAIQGGYVVINGKMDITNNLSNGTGGGIYAEISENEAAGSLIFKSTAEVDISYNTAATGNGGGIYMGTWDGNISSNSPPLQANKLTVRAEKPTMDIHDNTAAYGGGISVGLYSPTEQNQNKYWAADIFFESYSNAVDASSSIYIYDNKATYSEKPMGGGIFVRQNPHNSNNSNEHSTRFTKCIVTNNYADNTSTGTGQGGGVALFNICQARFDECRIYDNHTTKNDGLGGGVYVEEESSTPKNLFNNCLIYENGKLDTIDNNQVYTQKGGGAYVNGPATFKGCYIYDNYASDEGGGLFMTHELAVLDGSQVHENNSSKGGGIHIQNGDIVGQSGPNKIYENTASEGGGIYYIDGRIRKVSYANYVYDNTAAQNGGGVFVLPKGKAGSVDPHKTISHLFVGTDDASATNKGNRAVDGGGIYVKNEIDTIAPYYVSITFEACSIVYNKLQSDGTTTINRGGGVFMEGPNSAQKKRKYKVNLAGNTIIHGNEANYGGGVYVKYNGYNSATQEDNPESLKLELTQTTLSGNKATTKDGGGIYNEKGIVLCNANGSFTFDGNEANGGSGGGIYNQEGTLTLQGTDGGQIFKKNKAFRVSSSGGNGGGMYLNGGTVLLKNCDVGIANTGTGDIRVNGNEAQNGGGIYFYGGSLDLDNTRVSYNQATQNGGGIYQNCSNPLILQGVTLSYNDATVNGGGLLNNTNRATTINSNTTFLHNTAGNGGGIYNLGDVTIASATFNNNIADKDGGGIYNDYKKTTTITTSATFNGNIANNNGGGINNQGTVNGNNSTVSFVGNQAPTGNGGGIYNLNILDLDGTNTKTFTGNTAKNGGGIYNDSIKYNEPIVVPPPPITLKKQIKAPGATNWNNATLTDADFEGRVRLYYGYRYTNITTTMDSLVLFYDYNFGTGEGGDLGINAYRKKSNGLATYIYLYAAYTPTQDEIDGGYGSTYRLYVSTDRFDSDNGLTLNVSNNTNLRVTLASTTYSNWPNGYSGMTNSYGGRGDALNTTLPTSLNLAGTANLSNCVIGGSAANANKATNGHGGGIYIDKGSTVTMTVENEVTHNTATGHGGGVYKGGTLKVKDMVTVTDNTAGTAKGEGATEGEEAAEEATEEAAEP